MGVGAGPDRFSGPGLYTSPDWSNGGYPTERTGGYQSERFTGSDRSSLSPLIELPATSENRFG